MSEIIKMKNNCEISIEEGFNKFFRWCKLKGFSDYTLEFYDESRMNFARFKNLEDPITDINRELLEDYILFLQKCKILFIFFTARILCPL